MIRASNITLSFGGRNLFDGLTFFIGAGEKVGLTGKNGAGKSTLLKVLLGAIKPDSGSVDKEGGCTLGYLAQEMDHDLKATVHQTAMRAFDELNRMEARLEELGRLLAERTDYESPEYMRLTQELSDGMTWLSLTDGSDREAQVAHVLKGLGFTERDFARPLHDLSGGWRMRAELATILLSQPTVLLLDEPTNHLDIDSVEWLESYLAEFPGAILLISHDKAFLDNITTRTIEISQGKAYDYKANYSKYLELRRADIERTKREKKNQEKYVKHTEELINKFRAKKNKAAFAQSLIKKLDKLEEIEVDEFDVSKMHFRFPPAPRSGKVVIEGNGMGRAFGDKRVFQDLDFMLGRQDKVALVGQNGAGKSTLLRLLAGNDKGEGSVELGHNVEMGYFGQFQGEDLNPEKTVLATIEDEADEEMRPRVRALLGAFLFGGDDVGKKVKVLSGGEKSRLAMCKLLLKPHNFLILDEPTNHLDIPSKEVLKAALRDFEGTLLVVSHDRDFLKGLTTKVYELRKGELKIHLGDIYDFLQERKAETIRDFEKTKVNELQAAAATRSDKVKSVGSSENRDKQIKKLEQSQEKLERQIEELEAEVERLGALMSQSTTAWQEHAHHFEQVQQRLESAMKSWEATGRELEQLT